MRPDSFAQVTKTGIRMMLETTLAPGRYQMRIAAGNRKANTGSVVYGLDVPDFTTESLVMSGVAIRSAATSRIMTMNSKSPIATESTAVPNFARNAFSRSLRTPKNRACASSTNHCKSI
jgi:hypothetical protein